MTNTKDQNLRKRGDYYESIVRQYLASKGLKFLDGNYFCRYGEIDLILLDTPKTLVFAEVKFRSNVSFGHATEMVGVSKQRKMRLTALHYLQQHPRYQKLNCRFDVIGVSLTKGGVDAAIDWIQNAFS